MRDDETNLEQSWEAEGAASGCKALAIHQDLPHAKGCPCLRGLLRDRGRVLEKGRGRLGGHLARRRDVRRVGSALRRRRRRRDCEV